MINNVKVKGLKSIDCLDIELKKLNILVGTNSSGKSTFIQSILLASQNINNLSSPLNGKLVSLGEFRETRNHIINAQAIGINIDFDDSNYAFTIVESDENKEDFSKLIDDSNLESDDENNPLITKELLDRFRGLYMDRRIYYLSSSRIGHRDIYEKNYSNDFKFGLEGEYCLHYFEKHKGFILDDRLTNIYKVSNTLESQVNYWLKYIVGMELSTTDIKETDRIKANFISGSRSIRTKNVGSGISYLVSIIIMCLSIKEEDTIIIENPEIHLHPKAQSKLIEFFIYIANTNRQIILETHSDHIFNGVRVAVTRKQINDDDYTINFFSLDDRGCTKVDNIKVSKRGRIVDAPEGLFDQFEIDIDRMLGLKDYE